MNREQVAEILVDELIEELAVLEDRLLAFGDRWVRYGEEFREITPPAKIQQLETACNNFLKNLDRFNEG